MPITKNGNGALIETPITDKDQFDRTGVIRDDAFAIAEAGDKIKQIKFDPGPQDTNTTLTLRSGAISSDVVITFPATSGTLSVGSGSDSFSTIQPPAGTSPVADSSADTLNLTTSDSKVTITGTASTDTLDFTAPTLVEGPSSATDNAVARFDATSGKLIQNSGATIDDSGNLTATNVSGTNTGNVTLAAIGSSANANGATLSSQALNLEPASASFGGVVTTGTQSMAGAKTFTTNVTSPQYTQDGSGTSNGVWGQHATYTNYSVVGLAGGITSATLNFTSAPDDTHLYISRPSGKNIYFRETFESTSGQMVLNSGGTLSTSNITVAGSMIATQGTDNVVIAARANGTQTANLVEFRNSSGTAQSCIGPSGDIKTIVAGRGYFCKEGSNACMGVATLSAGAVTVSTTKVTATSRIFLTSQVDGGVPGFVRVSARTASTSFTITSSNVADTSDIAWLIVEPS